MWVKNVLQKPVLSFTLSPQGGTQCRHVKARGLCKAIVLSWNLAQICVPTLITALPLTPLTSDGIDIYNLYSFVGFKHCSNLLSIVKSLKKTQAYCFAVLSRCYHPLGTDRARLRLPSHDVTRVKFQIQLLVFYTCKKNVAKTGPNDGDGNGNYSSKPGLSIA